MIFWSGFGYLVPIAAIAALVLGQVLAESAWGPTAQSMSLFVAGIEIWLIEKYFISKRKEENLVNVDTGEQKILRKNDSFMFIPFRFWPSILGIGAILIYSL